MKGRGLFVWLHTRIHRDQRGFTMVEAMIAGFVLAVGAFAIAEALGFGLGTSGLARQRLAAKTLAEGEMETARSINYDNLVLHEATVTHSTDSGNPDYWVRNTGGNPEYDADGTGGSGYEPLIVDETVSAPFLTHLQTGVMQGSTSFDVYTYVTWVDSPTDGLGGADLADGNADGEDDAEGRDLKRVTVAVIWDSVVNGVPSLIKVSSLFSDGKVPYRAPSAGAHANVPPSVGCPSATADGLTVYFTAQATDADGSVVQIDWDFGDGQTAINGGANHSHTYASAGNYAIENVAHDDDGASGSNASLGCQLTVSAGGGAGGMGPTCTVSIAGGADNTNNRIVTLTVTSVSGNPATMQFSEDGSNWGVLQTFSTSAIYTIASAGDGTKTVYARCLDNPGRIGPSANDSIVLDTTPPGAPTNLVVTRGTGNEKKDATISWIAPTPLPSDLAGYQVFRRSVPSGAWVQVACTVTGPTSCTDSGLFPSTNYQYYVVAVDTVGNQSDPTPPSNTV